MKWSKCTGKLDDLFSHGWVNRWLFLPAAPFLSLMLCMICLLLCISQHDEVDSHRCKLNERNNFSIYFCFLLFSASTELARRKQKDSSSVCVGGGFWQEAYKFNTEEVPVAKASCFSFASVNRQKLAAFVLGSNESRGWGGCPFIL